MYTLYISGTRLPGDAALTVYLQKMKLPVTITSTNSVVVDMLGRHNVEPGARIIFSRKEDLERAWPELAEEYGLGCGYLRTWNFNGCILDFLRESACPGRKLCLSRSMSAPQLRVQPPRPTH